MWSLIWKIFATNLTKIDMMMQKYFWKRWEAMKFQRNGKVE